MELQYVEFVLELNMLLERSKESSGIAVVVAVAVDRLSLAMVVEVLRDVTLIQMIAVLFVGKEAIIPMTAQNQEEGEEEEEVEVVEETAGEEGVHQDHVHALMDVETATAKVLQDQDLEIIHLNNARHLKRCVLKRKKCLELTDKA